VAEEDLAGKNAKFFTPKDYAELMVAAHNVATY
jgi:hypothetical protein